MMVIYFFCAQARDKHFDGSIQREERIASNKEYNEVRESLKLEISTRASVSVDEINITSLNLL